MMPEACADASAADRGAGRVTSRVSALNPEPIETVGEPRPGRHRDLVLDDALRSWSPPETISDEARAFRVELGLPTDVPVVMTGHQASFWHAGILAKYLALDAIARRRGAHPAWCVPDHVADRPGSVAWPAPANGPGAGRWTRRETDLLAASAPDDLPPLLLGVRERLLADHTHDASDRQIRAHAAVLRDRLGLATHSPVVLASGLRDTTAFAGLVERMKGDPNACTASYNRAASSHPDAGVRALAFDEHDPANTELPLWAVTGSGTLMGVRAGDLDRLEPATIRPRALLFTGLLRALGCDLFIHGTGGGSYDRVTEAWLDDWLGWTLAPTGVVTATLTLDLGIPDVTRADLREAHWRAHHARHNPGTIGDTPDLRRLDDEKRALAGAIADADPLERARLFAEMHRLLADTRRAHADAIAAMDARVEAVDAGLADRAIAQDRTWPWMLHSDADLLALRDDVDRQLGAGG